MRHVLGFIMFWTGIGILISLLMPNTFCTVVLAGILLLVGYNLFCGC